MKTSVKRFFDEKIASCTKGISFRIFEDRKKKNSMS
jgi:hypothetical protein